MDLQSLTFAGLVAIGIVNVISFYKPGLSSEIKFAISFVAAFLVGFIPADLGNQIFNHAIDAIELALMASGGYKIAQKVGGK
ncbi:MAG: hypothetical protein WC871_02410 [Bacteroidales bacterium]|jgi:hypothetical protein